MNMQIALKAPVGIRDQVVVASSMRFRPDTTGTIRFIALSALKCRPFFAVAAAGQLYRIPYRE